MQVEVAERRQIDHPLRNDAAIAHDDDGLRSDLLQLSAEFLVVLDPVRLDDGQVECEGDTFDRRRDNFHAAAAGPIRLRHDQLHAEARGYKLLECGYGELGGAAKDQVEHKRLAISN